MHQFSCSVLLLEFVCNADMPRTGGTELSHVSLPTTDMVLISLSICISRFDTVVPIGLWRGVHKYGEQSVGSTFEMHRFSATK